MLIFGLLYHLFFFLEIVLEPYSDTKTWKQSVYGENLIINQLILGSKAYGVNEVLVNRYFIISSIICEQVFLKCETCNVVFID